jgi:hypothetical protein
MDLLDNGIPKEQSRHQVWLRDTDIRGQAFEGALRYEYSMSHERAL